MHRLARCQQQQDAKLLANANAHIPIYDPCWAGVQTSSLASHCQRIVHFHLPRCHRPQLGIRLSTMAMCASISEYSLHCIDGWAGPPIQKTGLVCDTTVLVRKSQHRGRLLLRGASGHRGIGIVCASRPRWKMSIVRQTGCYVSAGPRIATPIAVPPNPAATSRSTGTRCVALQTSDFHSCAKHDNSNKLLASLDDEE